MHSSTPNLMTLLGWANRLAAGGQCAEWDAWRKSSPDAGEQWKRILRAREALERGAIADAPSEFSAEDMAEFIEGRLPKGRERHIEDSCWNSIDSLAEVLSAKKFEQHSALTNPSSALEARLLALGSQGRNGHRLVEPHDLSTAPAPPTSANVALPKPPEKPPQAVAMPWRWFLAAAALFLVAIVSGGLGWLVATRQSTPRQAMPIASSQAPPRASSRPTEELPGGKSRQPETELLTPSIVNSQPPASDPEPQKKDALERSRQRDIAVVQPPAPVPQEAPSGVGSRSASRAALPPQAELRFHTVQGLMLADTGGQGRWQVAKGRLPLYEPIQVVSLAESWTSIEVPRFGTLLFDGPAEAALAVLADGMVEIRLSRGKLAIQDMITAARVRFETSGATWTARGVGERSTLAVLDDPLAPSLTVSKGAIAVEELAIGAGQHVRWYEGVPQSAGPQANTDVTIGNLVWLQPPDDKRQKQWNTMFGKLVDRLSAADDAKVELKRLLSISKDMRQAALLAQWNVSVADEADRSQQAWSMLTERREPLRVAGVKCLLELVPGDPRLRGMIRSLREQIGDETTMRVIQWLAASRQLGELSAPQAIELVDHLGHDNVAVRQIAVSLLELHLAPAFQQGLFQRPAYDAAAPASRRAATQMEWKMIIKQLYTPTRRNPMGLGAALKPMQPGSSQNSAPSIP